MEATPSKEKTESVEENGKKRMMEEMVNESSEIRENNNEPVKMPKISKASPPPMEALATVRNYFRNNNIPVPDVIEKYFCETVNIENSLPVEVLVKIFNYLPNQDIRCGVSLACKMFYEICRDESLVPVKDLGAP